MDNPYFSVGYHKYEMDFSVRADVGDLSYGEIRRLRELIVVGIGVLEEMLKAEQQRKQAPAQSAIPQTLGTNENASHKNS